MNHLELARESNLLKGLLLIFQQIQVQYRLQETPTRLTKLKLSMFTKEDKPWAQSPFPNCKGAEKKRLAPALLEVCKAVLD